MRRFGIKRTVLPAAPNVSVFQPLPRAFHAQHPINPGLRGDVVDPRAILGACFGRKNLSSNRSNSTRHRTPVRDPGVRRRSLTRLARANCLLGHYGTRSVRYDDVLEGTAGQQRQGNEARCVATKDAIKSRSATGCQKTGGGLEERFFATGEDGARSQMACKLGA